MIFAYIGDGKWKGGSKNGGRNDGWIEGTKEDRKEIVMMKRRKAERKKRIKEREME